MFHGSPGEVKGTINDEVIGEINQNTEFGLYGVLSNIDLLELSSNEPIEVALRSEIEEGEAFILTNIGEGDSKEYSVEIQKIFINNNEDNKSFVIKVTDEELISETGGIIRGLSRKSNFAKWKTNTEL